MLPQRFTRTQRPDEKYVAIGFAETGLTKSMLRHRFKHDEKYFAQSVYTQIGPDRPSETGPDEKYVAPAVYTDTAP